MCILSLTQDISNKSTDVTLAKIPIEYFTDVTLASEDSF